MHLMVMIVYFYYYYYPRFWIVSSCNICWSAIGTAIFFHISDIFAAAFKDSDQSRVDSILRTVYISQSIFSGASSLAMGFLFDKYRLEYLLIFATSMQVVATLSLSLLRPTMTSALTFALMFGLQNGSMNNMASMAYAKLFGRKELNRITSVATSLVVVGSALGPLPLGAAHDLFHGYSTALMIAAMWPAANVVLLAVNIFLTSRKKKVIGSNGQSIEKLLGDEIELLHNSDL